MAVDTCVMTGAAQKTKEAAFECIMGVEPHFLANFFAATFVVILIIWWLRVSWSAMIAKNKGDYDWEDVNAVFMKPLVALMFFIAFFIFIL